MSENYQYNLMRRLPDELVEEYETAFNVFDRDNDGKINAKELGATMRSLGFNPTDEMLQEMENQADYDGDGMITFPEFVTMMEDQRKPDEEYDVVQAFRVFDSDNNGYIDSRDLREVLGHLETSIPSEELQKLLQETGLEIDRKISFEEFLVLLTPIAYNGDENKNVIESFNQ